MDRAPLRGPAGLALSAVMRPTLAALAVLLLPWIAHAQFQEQAAPVGVDPVRAETSSETVSVLGRIVARREGEVAARVSAAVDQVEVQVGDHVAADDILVRLDTTRLQLDRALAEAEHAAAVADHTATLRQLDLLRQERNRLDQLKGSAAFSKARLDDKRTEVTVTESRVQAAAARLERARVGLDYRTTDLADAVIRAPYAGVVVEKHVSAGAYVRVGDPVLVMIDDLDVEIEADVPAARLERLSPGEQLTFQIGGDPLEARIRAIIPVENPLTRTRAVRFEPVTWGDSTVLAIGQSVTVDLPVGELREVLTVHKDAVVVHQGQRVVFVVDKESKAQPRPVQLGAAIGGRFEVIEGLAPGERVVIRGNERLRPGQEVIALAPGNETGSGDTGASRTGEGEDLPAEGTAETSDGAPS